MLAQYNMQVVAEQKMCFINYGIFTWKWNYNVLSQRLSSAQNIYLL